MSGGNCPICGKPAVADSRPFCSRRCANVDLARWFGEGYAIPAIDQDDADSIQGGDNPANDKSGTGQAE